MHFRCYERYRMKTDRHWLHQELVTHARQHRMKDAARVFGCSRNTVRTWLRRYQPGKPSSLAERVSTHLAGHGVDLTRVVWQTDNGSEFLQGHDQRGLPAAVRALGSDHRYIPSKAYTWQSDIGTVHRLVQDEFFDRESFHSPAEFRAKANHLLALLQSRPAQSWQGMADAPADPPTLWPPPQPSGRWLALSWPRFTSQPIFPPLPKVGVTFYPSIPKISEN